MNRLLHFLPLLVLLSCAGERTITLNSVRPADIAISSNVKSILLLDRTKFDKDAINILEGILTGELPEEDKAAVQSLMNSLRLQLETSERFEVKIATERLKGNSLTSAFPDALTWGRVQSLCRSYGVDGIVAIELFDTDFIITETSKIVTRTVDEKEVQVEEFYAEGVDDIKIGIRVYNPKTKTIEDQQVFTRTGTWDASADTKAGALAALIGKTEATRNLSGELGASYAYRIAPMDIFITRTFRGKHKDAPALERGSRYADVGNWNRAIKVWKEGLRNPADKKVAGFLAYSIAVGYEAMGDLEEAKYWAGKAYTQYDNKKGASYVGLINDRIRNEEISRQQMGK